MIVFVGDKPSKKNVDPSVPFVGTQSYKKLLEWIWVMNLNINDIYLCNKEDVTLEFQPGNFASLKDSIIRVDKVVALGEAASKELNQVNVPHFKLPHPSGLNRKLNDKKYMKEQLQKCKEWLKCQN